MYDVFVLNYVRQNASTHTNQQQQQTWGNVNDDDDDDALF